jgi:hypothetical protein
MSLADLLEHQQALRAMLGIADQPAYLDLKPGPLSDAVRSQLARRLAEVNREVAGLGTAVVQRFRKSLFSRHF